MNHRNGTTGKSGGETNHLAGKTTVVLEESDSTVADSANPSPAPSEQEIAVWEDDGGAVPADWRPLIFHLPLNSNDEIDGKRVPIEPEQLEETKAEILAMFPGGTWYPVSGWCRAKSTGKCVVDDALRYEIDGVYDAHQLAQLKNWKRKLETRFEQWDIYMKLGAPNIRL